MKRAAREQDLKAPIYPAYCHRLSPTNSSLIWCPLFAADIHTLRSEAGYEGQNIYFHLNHPFKFVQIIAKITDIHIKQDARKKTITLHLDDSSAAPITAELKIPLTPPPQPDRGAPPTSETPSFSEKDFPDFIFTDPDSNIGKLVKVKGILERHWLGHLQIGLRRYSVVGDSNEEVRFWEKVTQFRGKWGMPWVLSEGEVRECREERERAERVIERRGRRRGEKGRRGHK